MNTLSNQMDICQAIRNRKSCRRMQWQSAASGNVAMQI